MVKIATEAQITTHLQTLTEAPQCILDCTAEMDELQLKTAPAPGEWSIVEIMAHVRGSAEVWSNSIYAMLSQEKPQLTYIHPRTWVKKQGYPKLSFAENFQAYKVERDNLLHTLRGLSFEDWGRSATFTGKVNTFTVFGETMRMALHEADHCQQLQKTFKQS